MSLENLEEILKFFEKSNYNIVQLAGGEPTLHSKFKEILLKLITCNMRINILSNALWNPELNSLFAQISPLSLGFLLNIDQPKTYTAQEWAAIEHNLSFLSSRGNITLSYNIQEKNPSYDYILKLVEKYGFKNIRLSFSMPVIFNGRKNTHLQIGDYKKVGKDVVEFTRKVEALGAKVGMDNTVPICMFTPEELGELLLKQVVVPERNFVCYPAIDIGPDLSIWRCFGTSKLFNKKLSDFNSLEEIYEYYQRASRLYQFKYFPLEECKNCNYAIEERCQGGCIGFAEAKCEELGCTVTEPSKEAFMELKPKLPSGASLHRYQIPRETLTIKLPNKEELEIPLAAAELITLLDGKRTIKEAIALKMQESIGPSTQDDLNDFLVEVSSQKIVPIIQRLIDQKALIV
jgi:MoaA/NifB/PqqE/SkfB family radical SAM enzyme